MELVNLLLPHTADHVLPVAFTAVGDVNPVGGGAVLVLAMLHDTLVEGEVGDEPLHPTSALGEGWDTEVGCFAFHVLAPGCTSDFGVIVELRTAVAGTDVQRLADVLTKWFKDFGTECLDVGNYLCMLWIVRIERVIDAISACGS